MVDENDRKFGKEIREKYGVKLMERANVKMMVCTEI